MKKFLMTSLVILLFPFSAFANKGVVEGAMGFMLGGDKGWQVTKAYEIKGCKVTYIQEIKQARLIIITDYDFTKANFKTAKIVNRNNKKWFSVSGDKGLQVLNGVQDGKNGDAGAAALGLPVGRTNKIEFPLMVTQDRFIKAFKDLRGQCPGKKSKY